MNAELNKSGIMSGNNDIGSTHLIMQIDRGIKNTLRF